MGILSFCVTLISSSYHAYLHPVHSCYDAIHQGPTTSKASVEASAILFLTFYLLNWGLYK